MGQVTKLQCSCLVTWFCYQLIAKPGNNTAAVSVTWPIYILAGHYMIVSHSPHQNFHHFQKISCKNKNLKSTLALVLTNWLHHQRLESQLHLNDLIHEPDTVKPPGLRFNIKMPSYQYRKSHCGNKTILRPSYLHNGISYTLSWVTLNVSTLAKC